jgi:hypothetical protein
MAMPQRDETIEEIKRLDALLEYAVMHEDEAEAVGRATPRRWSRVKRRPLHRAARLSEQVGRRPFTPAPLLCR